MMLISERIYKYMEEKGISQIEFAKRTGISQSTISDWRRKGTNPSADKIMTICEVLDISPYELLSGTENKKMKEYKQTDCIVIDKQSNEYALVEMYQNLNRDARKRLEGYMKALSDMK
ncbi:MAG: helix-turn-helix transcriptional regulator [Roseburia sp.]|nr:helix-turn-helix transcriptional regulator [Roseburia sp.]